MRVLLIGLEGGQPPLNSLHWGPLAAPKPRQRSFFWRVAVAAFCLGKEALPLFGEGAGSVFVRQNCTWEMRGDEIRFILESVQKLASNE